MTITSGSNLDFRSNPVEFQQNRLGSRGNSVILTKKPVETMINPGKKDIQENLSFGSANKYFDVVKGFAKRLKNPKAGSNSLNSVKKSPNIFKDFAQRLKDTKIKEVRQADINKKILELKAAPLIKIGNTNITFTDFEMMLQKFYKMEQVLQESNTSSRGVRAFFKDVFKTLEDTFYSHVLRK
ncbi:MAG: hypothetical protein A2287_09310 [Candidatus Melainabacteria bacterium RIFOXYA12_FULL_32_12]|nr:MAG: hypothetical protein A2287_09310 [Candidatus Melainabacteria bacterium RIFOXYA12_FULL_32_12]